MMKAHEALIAWSVGGPAGIGPLLTTSDTVDWTDPYDRTGGAAYGAVRKALGHEATVLLLAEFITMVVRDGVDALQAHHVFMEIEEYRAVMPEDVPGFSKYVDDDGL